jgi:hypothetical protein
MWSNEFFCRSALGPEVALLRHSKSVDGLPLSGQ